MLADLDLRLTAVFCTADELLPATAKDARRSVTDAEPLELAHAIFALAARALKDDLFPKPAQAQPGYHKRRARLTRDDRVADRRLRAAITRINTRLW